MTFWQALVVALIPSLAAIITATVAFRDLGLRRRLETSQQFLSLFALAHGRLDSGRAVGVGEQIATVHLIADFAAQEKVVRNAAREGLRHLTSWGESVAAKDMLASIGSDVPEDQRRTVAEAAAREVNRRSDAAIQIAKAAKEALERIP